MQVNRSETWFRKKGIVDSYIGPLEGKTFELGICGSQPPTLCFGSFMSIYNQFSISFVAFKYICFSSIRWDVHVHIHWGPHVEPGYAGFVVAWRALNKAPGVTLGCHKISRYNGTIFFEMIWRVRRFETHPTEGQVLSSGLAVAEPISLSSEEGFHLSRNRSGTKRFAGSVSRM